MRLSVVDIYAAIIKRFKQIATAAYVDSAHLTRFVHLDVSGQHRACDACFGLIGQFDSGGSSHGTIKIALQLFDCIIL